MGRHGARQLGASGSLLCKNPAVDSNVASTCKPIDRSKLRERLAQGCIVVDDKDDRRLLRAFRLSSIFLRRQRQHFGENRSRALGRTVGRTSLTGALPGSRIRTKQTAISTHVVARLIGPGRRPYLAAGSQESSLSRCANATARSFAALDTALSLRCGPSDIVPANLLAAASTLNQGLASRPKGMTRPYRRSMAMERYINDAGPRKNTGDERHEKSVQRKYAPLADASTSARSDTIRS